MGFGISFLWIDLHLPFFFFSVKPLSSTYTYLFRQKRGYAIKSFMT
ncbi:hypothetical protein PORCRE_357 [Porphyromonas crevioricanis JCM 15906]|uniref:Uncharacterized protein n=1 Tax=Porphyromonas crevioricanis JCM 15906 TaxID=1305617 RepID=T1CG70_9PORP|nr:hypothetical protein PORCRE_357 [Porphyromonas crevioricanis JCM 15906]